MFASITPDFEGYITKTENKRMLVVSPKAKDFSSTGGLTGIWVIRIKDGLLSEKETKEHILQIPDKLPQ